MAVLIHLAGIPESVFVITHSAKKQTDNLIQLLVCYVKVIFFKQLRDIVT